MSFNRRPPRLGVATPLLALLLAVPAYAADGSHGGHHMDSPAAASTGTETPATAAYRAAGAKMHADMDMAFTGDADVDFVRGMIPHHEGAVAMARIVLEHGKDPEIRKLAEAVVKAQAEEIAFMKAWLARKGVEDTPSARSLRGEAGR